jgi:hypothetical protein
MNYDPFPYTSTVKEKQMFLLKKLCYPFHFYHRLVVWGEIIILNVPQCFSWSGIFLSAAIYISEETLTKIIKAIAFSVACIPDFLAPYL